MLIQKRFFSKIFSKEFLQRQIQTNPEFDKAFPHLAQYKQPTTVYNKFKEMDFIQSLKYENRVTEFKTIEESLKKNLESFVEGFRSPKGPFELMSQEQKDQIHEIIEQRMQEYENTGLSRQEIISDKPVQGIPLKQDPFFQFFKNNRLAREMMIKKGEEFNADKILDLVLKQEIGPDPSIARFPLKSYTMQDEKSGYLKKIEQNFALKTKPTDKQLQEELSIYLIKGKDLIYHRLPVKASQKRKKFQRQIQQKRRVNWYDIHWRNTELLTDFLTLNGRIKGRYQTRLPGNVQWKISKTIKHSRKMMLIPMGGYIKASDRRSLRSLQEDIQDFTRTSINLETGQIVLTPQSGIQYDFKQKYPMLHTLNTMIEPEDQIVKANLYAKYLKKEEQILKGQPLDISQNSKFSQGININDDGQNQIILPDLKVDVDVKDFEKDYQKVLQDIDGAKTQDLVELLLKERAGIKLQQEKQNSSSIPKEELYNELYKIKLEIGIAKF